MPKNFNRIIHIWSIWLFHQYTLSGIGIVIKLFNNGTKNIIFLVIYHHFVGGNDLPVTYLTQTGKHNIVN